MSFIYLSDFSEASTDELDIKSISINSAGILVFLSTENDFEIFTPRLGVFIVYDRLEQIFFDSVYSLLFSSYTHTSTPLADLLVAEFMCMLTK